MPSNVELCLISSVLRSQDYPTALGRGVATDHFHSYDEEWTWMTDYFTRNRKTPSKIAFKQAFPEFTLKAVNDTGHFSDEVRKSHARYCMTSAMRDVADLIGKGDIDGAVRQMHGQIITVAAGLGTTNDNDVLTDFHSILGEVEGRAKRVAEKGHAGIPTGFQTLDERTGGPQPGHIWVFAARLGEGKSWALQRAATAALLAGYVVQYDALEMSRAEVTMRVQAFLASGTGQQVFNNLDLMLGRNFDMKAYKNFVAGLKSKMKSESAFHVSDTSRGRVSTLTIAAQIERNKPDIVFVDPINLMAKNGDGGHLSVQELSGELKTLAGEYAVPIVLAAQLNRDAAMGKDLAGTEKLAESDAIGRDADAVITGRLMSQQVMAQKLAKYRHGPANFKWYLKFQPGKGIMEEVSYNDALTLIDQDRDAADKDSDR